MSRIFDALRKSEKRVEQKSFFSPESFLDSMEKIHGSSLQKVATVRAHVSLDSRLIVRSDPCSLGAERFRLLRTHLNGCQAAKKVKTVLVTSALPQDGKSLVAANLAIALASQQGCSVLLIEADLRQGGLVSTLGLKGWPGLSESLEQGAGPLAGIRRVEPLGFFLLPAGAPPANPVELLQSLRFSELMRSLAALFDWVLLDSPPTGPLADAPVLKTHTDASLLVVRAGTTPVEAVEEALHLVGPEHVIGVVLNGAEGIDTSYYSYYQRYTRNPPSRKSSGDGKKNSQKQRAS